MKTNYTNSVINHKDCGRILLLAEIEEETCPVFFYVDVFCGMANESVMTTMKLGDDLEE